MKRPYAKKSPARLDREITEALKRRATKKSHARAKELFYLSEDQQGGKYAEHFERFDNLGDAIDMLARLPAGSITYGNSVEGPKFMLVWAAPAYSELLYWTDGDLNVQDKRREEAAAIKKQQTKRYGNLDARFRQAIKQ
jgi:hypothetical protein